MSTNLLTQTKMYAFISHSPQTYPNNQPNIDNMPLARRKRRRTLVVELAILQKYFNICKTPNRSMRLEIASKVNMDEKSVQIWFQNKRQSMRKGERGVKQVTVIPEVLIHQSSNKSDSMINKPNLQPLQLNHHHQISPILQNQHTSQTTTSLPPPPPLINSQSYPTLPTLSSITRSKLADGISTPNIGNFTYSQNSSFDSTLSREELPIANVVNTNTNRCQLPMIHFNKSTSSLPSISSSPMIHFNKSTSSLPSITSSTTTTTNSPIVTSPNLEISLPSLNNYSTSTKLPPITLPSINTTFTPKNFKSIKLPPTPLTNSQIHINSNFNISDRQLKMDESFSSEILSSTPLNNKKICLPITPLDQIPSSTPSNKCTTTSESTIMSPSHDQYDDDSYDVSYIEQKTKNKVKPQLKCDSNFTLVETKKRQPSYFQNSNNQSLTFKITKNKIEKENTNTITTTTSKLDSKRFKINDLLNTRKPLGNLCLNSENRNCIDSLMSLKSGKWNN